MALRICHRDRSAAADTHTTLALAGYAASLETDPLAGPDRPAVFLVQTDAPADVVAELLDGSDQAWLEVSDPMSGTSAVVEP